MYLLRGQMNKGRTAGWQWHEKVGLSCSTVGFVHMAKIKNQCTKQGPNGSNLIQLSLINQPRPLEL